MAKNVKPDEYVEGVIYSDLLSGYNLAMMSDTSVKNEFIKEIQKIFPELNIPAMYTTDAQMDLIRAFLQESINYEEGTNLKYFKTEYKNTEQGRSEYAEAYPKLAALETALTDKENEVNTNRKNAENAETNYLITEYLARVASSYTSINALDEAYEQGLIN